MAVTVTDRQTDCLLSVWLKYLLTYLYGCMDSAGTLLIPLLWPEPDRRRSERARLELAPQLLRLGLATSGHALDRGRTGAPSRGG